MIDAIPDTQPTTNRQRREALYHAFEEHVDPATYDGKRDCLIDQTVASLRGDPWYAGDVEYLASRFDVDEALIQRIYSDAGDEEYRHDYAAAIQMAKQRLGL